MSVESDFNDEDAEGESETNEMDEGEGEAGCKSDVCAEDDWEMFIDEEM
jgi:hypothetical protein